MQHSCEQSLTLKKTNAKRNAINSFKLAAFYGNKEVTPIIKRYL